MIGIGTILSFIFIGVLSGQLWIFRIITPVNSDDIKTNNDGNVYSLTDLERSAQERKIFETALEEDVLHNFIRVRRLKDGRDLGDETESYVTNLAENRIDGSRRYPVINGRSIYRRIWKRTVVQNTTDGEQKISTSKNSTLNMTATVNRTEDNSSTNNSHHYGDGSENDSVLFDSSAIIFRGNVSHIHERAASNETDIPTNFSFRKIIDAPLRCSGGRKLDRRGVCRNVIK